MVCEEVWGGSCGRNSKDDEVGVRLDGVDSRGVGPQRDDIKSSNGVAADICGIWSGTFSAVVDALETSLIWGW